MERNKEAIKKSCSDIYTSKKVGISKSTFLKNNSNLTLRSDPVRSKISYISRPKNVSIPIDKKYNFYGSETKSYLKHSCGIKARSQLVVNATSASPTDSHRIESGRDLNGNVSFGNHPTLCNFATSVAEISTFNKVLSFHSNKHYELSLPKSTKHKQRTTFTEHRTFSSKVSNSNNSFTTNKFFSSLPNSAIRCHYSKSVPQKFNSPEQCLKSSDRTSRESIALIEKYNSKYDLKYSTLPDTNLAKDSVKFADLPVFVNSSLPQDPSMFYKVDYCEDQLQLKKQRNYSSRKWDPTPTAPELGECSQILDDTNKMLFPALPSNNHSQENKVNSSSSMSPSEHSSVENSDLESPHSLPSTSTNLNAAISTSVPSTIPQASYADVIRMSVTCNPVQGYVALDFDKTAAEPNPLTNNLTNPIQEKLPNDENPQPGSSDWVISRLSQLDLITPDPISTIALTHCTPNGQNFVAPRPIVVSLEKPSFYNSSLQTCKNVLGVLSSHSSLPSSDKKIAENDSLAVDCLNSIENVLDDNTLPGSTNRSSVSLDLTTSLMDIQVASIKTDSIYSSPSSVSSFGDAFKPVENKDLINSLLKKDPPVVIMNNCSPPDSMSEISFGIEYDEMLKLCSDHAVQDNDTFVMQETSEELLLGKNTGIDNLHSRCSKNLVLNENNSISVKSESNTSLHRSIYVKGKGLHWNDSDVDYSRDNHMQLAEYLAGVWDNIGKEFEKGSAHVNGSIHYFHE